MRSARMRPYPLLVLAALLATAALSTGCESLVESAGNAIDPNDERRKADEEQPQGLGWPTPPRDRHPPR